MRERAAHSPPLGNGYDVEPAIWTVYIICETYLSYHIIASLARGEYRTNDSRGQKRFLASTREKWEATSVKLSLAQRNAKSRQIECGIADDINFAVMRSRLIYWDFSMDTAEP
ncbi:hypothetical protein AC579_8927 [Pseudocercospora musae]|uniref:Uncharacterized protein n=1 Tax=Pseudocercospora musae TaxID=113226 RepID=A0A139HH75_9PEZI|nr:hypothetical protein AC579_8927 [Pseudocercospora musae]